MKNNQKQYDSEENKKAYDLSQRKCAMERNIRCNKANTSSGTYGNILGMGSGGSVSSEGKLIGKIDYEKAPEAISYFNREIKNEIVENAIVVNKTGSVFQFIGNSSSVEISGLNLEGAYITHNHPKSEGIVSFGEDDFIFLRENQNINLFCCCNEKYEYIIEVLQDFSKITYNEIYWKVLNFQVCQILKRRMPQ